VVPVGGKFRRHAELFPNPRLNRKTEVAYLRACVVVVELPRYAPALRLEQSADGVAKRRLSAVPDMERTR